MQLFHILINNNISILIVITNDRFDNLPEASLIIIIAITNILSLSQIVLTLFNCMARDPSSTWSLSLLTVISYQGSIATTAITNRFLNNFYLHGSSTFINSFHCYSDITLSLSTKGLTTSTCAAQQTSTSPTSDSSSTTMCATWERSASHFYYYNY